MQLKLAYALQQLLCWEPILITRNLSIFNFKNVFVLAFSIKMNISTFKSFYFSNNGLEN
jgi:hypothetical protein